MPHTRVARLLALGILLSSGLPLAEANSAPTTAANSETVDQQWLDMLFEAKVGYFQLEGQTTKKIYSGAPIYGAEIALRLWQPIYLWAGANYYFKNGRCVACKTSTHLDLVPLAVGLKFLFPLNIVDLYAGGGIQYAYMHTHDKSPYVIQKVHAWALGGIVNAGFLINVNKHFFFDVFGNYSFLKKDFHNGNGRVLRHQADLSGWTAGLGIGYRLR